MASADSDARDEVDMARLAAGHDAALNDLMARHAGPVFHFLYRMLGNADDANDLAQETFARVYRARDRFKSGQRFSVWLFTIAANLARNHLRWRQRHPVIPLEAEADDLESGWQERLAADDADPGQAAEAAERAAAVRAAVLALPRDLREAIVLCEWGDQPVAEAAAVLGTTPKAVESRLYRARNLLRKRLKRWL